jgi:elastase-2
MKLLILTACLALSHAAPRLGPLVPKLWTVDDSYIVNGQEANVGQFPWQASLLSSTSPTGSHTCGGVYIGSNWLLNVAHCTQSSARSAWFGIHRRSDTSGGEFRTFTRIVNHPDYGSGAGAYPNDISVLEMTSSVSGPNIQAATMAEGSNDYAGSTAAISGWGRTCGSCSLPDALQYVNMPVLSNAQCTTFWGSNINAGHVCVYNGNAGACNGDSGGPMTVGNTVIGLASWVASGCLSSAPSTYTRVSYFRDWIRSVTGL